MKTKQSPVAVVSRASSLALSLALSLVFSLALCLSAILIPMIALTGCGPMDYAETGPRAKPGDAGTDTAPSNDAGPGPSGEETTIAQTVIAEVLYSLSIVQTEGSSNRGKGGSPYFEGRFDAVVRDRTGLEYDRTSLNELFGEDQLRFDLPVDLVAHDYNPGVNNLGGDIPIGFPVNDGSGEYRYAILSVQFSGEISVVPAGGYKEDGFIYTAPAGHSIEFTGIPGVGEGAQRGMLVGVAKEGGGFAPAKYVWTGEKYEFIQEDPFVVGGADIDIGGKAHSIVIVQTDYKKPPTVGEPGFTIAESVYRGRFDLLVRDADGNVCSRMTLNDYFGGGDLGAGWFPITLQDYNGDGDPDFRIGRPHKGSYLYQYALFSLDTNGVLYNLKAAGYEEDGFIYDLSGPTGGLLLLRGAERGIQVGVKDYKLAEYVWDGDMFVFRWKR